ncbi:hypothetical protein [Parasediminibacterium sp. JCM 36343]|uniref:hypothetical protein n=1 Tax=Parasediminibacterium sp. JCM 36343 TaxID=3374279 RepID=UPI00397A884D
MKNTLLFSILFMVVACFFSSNAIAEKPHPDTVKTGIYITSIHDIDFKQNEYTAIFWLWLTYKKKEFDFAQNLEIPQAKTVTKSFSTVDSSNGQIYLLMKMQCVMKDSWRINNFPFDRQKLHLSIENSQFDAKSLVFVADTLGMHYDPKFTLKGWDIDSFTVSTGKKAYETAFGDASYAKPHSEYANFKVNIGISRSATELFWKMFLGMYVAFLISYICFYIHADNIDSRFGLSVGSLFAAIGNKYIIDASLPDSTSLTLVDTLHAMTLFFIFVVIVSSTYSLTMLKKGKVKQAYLFDSIAAKVVLVSYILLNIYYISNALKG